MKAASEVTDVPVRVGGKYHGSAFQKRIKGPIPSIPTTCPFPGFGFMPIHRVHHKQQVGNTINKYQ